MAKKRLQHGCFLVNFAKFYRAPLGKFFNKVIETFAKKIKEMVTEELIKDFDITNSIFFLFMLTDILFSESDCIPKSV